MSEVKAKEFWIDDRDNGDGYVVHEEEPTHVQCEVVHVISYDSYAALQKENEELKLQLEFTKQYFNPEDTSFKNMMDGFRELSDDQKNKLIDLSRSLARLAEAK
jgi:hypothetical protein